MSHAHFTIITVLQKYIINFHFFFLFFNRNYRVLQRRSIIEKEKLIKKN